MMFWYQSERGSHILADLICLMVPSGKIWFEFVIWLGLNSRLVALECLRQIRALFYNMCSLKLWSWEAFHDQTSLWSCVFGYCFILYSFEYKLLELIIHRMYEKALRRGIVKEIISTLFKFTLLKLSLPDFFFLIFAFTFVSWNTIGECLGWRFLLVLRQVWPVAWFWNTAGVKQDPPEMQRTGCPISSICQNHWTLIFLVGLVWENEKNEEYPPNWEGILRQKNKAGSSI